MPERPRHAFLAGGVSGILEISCTYPLEFVKNSMQLQPSRFRGPLHALRSNVAAHGPSVLYRGLPSWLLFAFPRSAIRFAFFDQFQGIIDRGCGVHAYVDDGDADDNADAEDVDLPELYRLSRDAAAGIGAGLIEAVLCLTPCQNLSIKMTHEANLPPSERRYSPRFFRATASIFRDAGLRGILAGVGPTCAKNCLNQSIRFPGFHFLTRAYCERTGTVRDRMNMLELWACGGVAGALSAVCSHPIDVVKANMMGLHASKYRSALHCATSIHAEVGVSGFFVGLSPRITRVCCEVGLLYSLFEGIKRSLDRMIK